MSLAPGIRRRLMDQSLSVQSVRAGQKGGPSLAPSPLPAAVGALRRSAARRRPCCPSPVVQVRPTASAPTGRPPAASAAPTKTQAERDAEDKKLRAESYKIMANMGNFALYLVIALVFTWFIGSAMDNFFGTTPIFTIFWIFCGIASTVLEVRKTLIAAKKLGESEQK